MMIETLRDQYAFRLRREHAWRKATEYWLSQELRHVTDVGDYITRRVSTLAGSRATPPLIVDMGFGSAWLLGKLLDSGTPCQYLGLDINDAFLAHARGKFGGLAGVDFAQVDLEQPISLPFKAHVVVNAFNLLELCDLEIAVANAAKLMTDDATFLVSTIDPTYLIIAVSDSWEQFRNNLKLYGEGSEPKYAFQRIDLGTGPAPDLEYASVLHSTARVFATAEHSGMRLSRMHEHVFTAKPVPKIYQHFEFTKIASTNTDPTACGGR